MRKRNEREIDLKSIRKKGRKPTSLNRKSGVPSCLRCSPPKFEAPELAADIIIIVQVRLFIIGDIGSRKKNSAAFGFDQEKFLKLPNT